MSVASQPLSAGILYSLDTGSTGNGARAQHPLNTISRGAPHGPAPLVPVALPTLPPRFRRPQLLEVLETSGSVVLVASDDAAGGRPVTIKAIPRAYVREEHETVSREVLNSHIISRYAHPNLVSLSEMLLTPDHVILTMDWFVPAMSLSRMLGNMDVPQPPQLSMAQVIDIFSCLMSALELCHSLGVVHRDVRPELIHVGPGGRVKLWGFSQSKVQNLLTQPKTRQGIVLFAPPEVMTGDEGQPYDGRRVDVWAAGVVLWMMVWGGHPFISQDEAQRGDSRTALAAIMRNCVTGTLQLPAGAAQEHPQLVSLLTAMLSPDPGARPSAGEVLQHAWLESATAAASRTTQLLQCGPLHGRPLQTAEQIEELLEVALADPEAEGGGEVGGDNDAMMDDMSTGSAPTSASGIR